MTLTLKEAEIVLFTLMYKFERSPSEIALCRRIMGSFPRLANIIKMSGLKV